MYIPDIIVINFVKKNFFGSKFNKLILKRAQNILIHKYRIKIIMSSLYAEKRITQHIIFY